MSLEPPEKIRSLQRNLYIKAKTEPNYRFYLLYDKVYREDILLHAYELAKANRGAPGVDGLTFAMIEKSGVQAWLSGIRQELCEKRYKPQAVRRVMIPKPGGSGERALGIPTVSDRVAQMVVKLMLEPKLEPIFLPDGYRPKKSALDAVGVTRERCWKYDWVLEFDIKGLFDNIDYGLLLKALEKHTDCKWVKLYIKRWLTAPLQLKDGTLVQRTRGTPQGGIVSPLLVNLF